MEYLFHRYKILKNSIIKILVERKNYCSSRAILCTMHESLRPGESKNEGRWTRRVTRVHYIQLYPVYTFRFTRGEVVSPTTLWFIGQKLRRGDGIAGCLHLFSNLISQLHIGYIQRETGDVVRSQFLLWVRILCDVKYILFTEYILEPERTLRKLLCALFQVFIAKAKQENNLLQFA